MTRASLRLVVGRLLIALAAGAWTLPVGALPVDERVEWTRAGGVAAVTVWGLAQWSYFQSAPRATGEGWFEANAPEGGADKLGHLYTSYLLARGLADLYEHWGLGRSAAARHGALTSLLVLGYMELGDSFSPEYGFSAEDMVMNLLGSGAGYWLAGSPTWRRRVDLRLEYRPGNSDPATDYGRQKYLVALKLAGFERFADGPLAWLELHFGYYARGYGSAAEPDTRNVYAGIGVNLSRLLAAHGWRRTATVLNYWQPPETSFAVSHRLAD